jgi:hypothetical protein
VFRNNQNKQKTNQNSSIFVKISTFLIPYTISSVCFDTGLKPKQTEKNFLVWQKKKPKNNQNSLSFDLFRFKPRKKINCIKDPLIDNVFLDFIRLFPQSSVCFGCFDTGPKILNKPKKMFFGFAKQTENNRNRLSFGLFRFEPKNKI